MGFDKNYVVEKMAESDFEIIDMETLENGNLIITIKHDIHPDIEVKVAVISEGEGEDDSMVLEFEGPDEYTEEEARQVLQDVMDMLVYIIEKALEETPTPVNEEDNDATDN